MNAQQIPGWTGDFVKKMHLRGVQKKDIANQLKYTPEYVGRVLSGKDAPKDAETRFNIALDELIAEKQKAP